MIPNATGVANVQTNIEGESGKFTLDASSMAHLMGVLSKLYADSELAVVREYLTNAYDSHIEAGTTRPIEVTLPSGFYSNYSVRDFGIGMDVNDIKNIYSKYGASTKRDSNDYVGTLGLGSKSALAYTTQFTVIGYKHGTKTTALISLDANGVPEFSIVDTCATSEPTGFEVIVPVKNHNSFAQKTYDFLKYWDSKLVLVNGKVPAELNRTLVKDFKHNNKSALVYRPHDYINRSVIVMGNVPYPVADEQVNTSIPDVHFVAYVPIGTVTIAPSREQLNYTPDTTAFIKALVAQMTEEVVKSYRKNIESAVTIRDARKRYMEIASYGIRNHLRAVKWRGHDVVRDYIAVPQPNVSYYSQAYDDWDGKQINLSNTGRFSLNNVDTYKLIVTGVDTQPTVTTKRKAHYVLSQQKGYSNVYPYPGIIYLLNDVVDPWLVGIPRITLENLKKTKLPSSAKVTQRTVRKENPPYLQWTVDANGSASRDLKVEVPKSKLLYMTPADLTDTYTKNKRTSFNTLIQSLPKGYTLVEVERNREGKFKRNNPHAGKPSKVMQSVLDDVVFKATADDAVAYYAQQSNLSRFFKTINPADIDDHDLKIMAKTVQNSAGQGSNPYVVAENIKSVWSKALVSVTYSIPANKNRDKDIIARYPLIASVQYGNMNNVTLEHITKYINRMYKENI